MPIKAWLTVTMPSAEQRSLGHQSTLDPRVVGQIARRNVDGAAIDLMAARALTFHGLAVETLASTDKDSLDPQASAVLSLDARAASLRGMAAAMTTASVAKTFRGDGIRAIFYKGAPLSVQLTGSLALRGSADVDVLVDSADLPAVHDSLLRMGCIRSDGRSDSPGLMLRYRECERSYTGLSTTIDLHWRVDSPGYFRRAFAEVWAERGSVVIGAEPVPTMGEIDALIVTAIHGTRERWLRWRWALDAHRQIDALDAEAWRQAVERAKQVGALRSLAMALAVAAETGLDRDWMPTPTDWLASTARSWLTADIHRSGDRPGSALRRRSGRWLLSDNVGTAVDGAMRALSRQLLPESRTFSWR